MRSGALVSRLEEDERRFDLASERVEEQTNLSRFVLQILLSARRHCGVTTEALWYYLW